MTVTIVMYLFDVINFDDNPMAYQSTSVCEDLFILIRIDQSLALLAASLM